MSKLLEVREPYRASGHGGFTVATARELIVNALHRGDFQCSDSDVGDQARRIDDTRECMGRIVEEFYNAGFLTTDSLARMAGVEPEYITETKENEQRT